MIGLVFYLFTKKIARVIISEVTLFHYAQDEGNGIARGYDRPVELNPGSPTWKSSTVFTQPRPHNYCTKMLHLKIGVFEGF